VYSTVDHINHGEQAEREALQWIEGAKGVTLTTAERDAYRAGFRAAWGKSRAAIQLHGLPRELTADEAAKLGRRRS